MHGFPIGCVGRQFVRSKQTACRNRPFRTMGQCELIVSLLKLSLRCFGSPHLPWMQLHSRKRQRSLFSGSLYHRCFHRFSAEDLSSFDCSRGRATVDIIVRRFEDFTPSYDWKPVERWQQLPPGQTYRNVVGWYLLDIYGMSCTLSTDLSTLSNDILTNRRSRDLDGPLWRSQESEDTGAMEVASRDRW